MDLYDQHLEVTNALMLIGFIFMLISVFGFLMYFLISFGIYKLSKNNKLENDAFWSFVPGLFVYPLGKLVEKEVHAPLRGYMGLINIILLVISVFFNLFTIIQFAFLCYSLYFLYKRFTNKYILFTVLSVVSLGLLIPLLVFILRNKKDTRHVEELDNDLSEIKDISFSGDTIETEVGNILVDEETIENNTDSILVEKELDDELSNKSGDPSDGDSEKKNSFFFN